MKQNFLMIACMFLIANSLFSQKQMSQGKIVMEITDISSSDPQAAAMMEMMRGTQTEINFNADGYCSISSMMGGMVEVKTYVNNQNKAYDMLIDMMGQKYWMMSNTEELAKQESSQAARDVKIEYNKDKRKKVQGYDCYEMAVSMPDNPEIKLVGYVTEEIRTDANIIQGLQSVKFAGFPIEYSMETPMAKITMTAVEIKDTVDEKKLKPDTSGYTKMSMDEFTQKMGGMRGFGF